MQMNRVIKNLHNNLLLCLTEDVGIHILLFA